MPQKKTTTGVGGTRKQVAFADINDDGRADYLYLPGVTSPSGDNNGRVHMWLNGGGPDNGPHAAEMIWQPRGEIATGDGTPAYQVMFADLNGDGRAEYLMVDQIQAQFRPMLMGVNYGHMVRGQGYK